MKKIYAIMIFCCVLAASAQSYKIGDLYTALDGSKGIVYYVHPDGSGGWVVALNDASTGCAWGAATDVPGLPNQNPSYFQNMLNDTAGYSNTQTLRTYQNNSATYAAGKVDFAHGWVLPSSAQLSMLYGQLPFVSTDIVNAGGTDLSADLYWCSGEYNESNACVVSFSSGITAYSSKTSSRRVRAVCSFSYTNVVHDTLLTYQWNTGSTQPYINVNPAQTTTYQVTATTDYGCSNTAEQTVLVGSGVDQTIYDTVCQGAGYESNGFTLTEDETGAMGTLTRNRTMETEGCSSNLTLQLMVNEPAATSFSATAHGSYIWNGVTYYESGEYTQHFNSANGCDSVVTLHLTVPVTPQVDITVTGEPACAGDSVTLAAEVLNMEALASATPVAVGDILCTDGTTVSLSDWPAAGKTALGVVFYVDNTGLHGWAVHLQDQGLSVQWAPVGQFVDIAALNNYSAPRDAITDLNGLSNTQNLRNSGDATQYPVAYAVDMDNGWYLPAAGQLRLLFAEFVTLNASLQAVGGTQFPMNNYYFYWTSTEYAGNLAWCIEQSGNMNSYSKNATHRVRSVRDF